MSFRSKIRGTQLMTSGSPGRRPRSRGLGRGVFTRRGVPSRARRRLGAAVRMLAALALAGGVYTAFAPGAFAEDNTTQLSATAQQGKELYENSCIVCHGRDAQAVPVRGPSLIGVGSAAVEFQVGTGRMPMTRQEA